MRFFTINHIGVTRPSLKGAIMKYRDLEIHNVSQIKDFENGMITLYRYPDDVIEKMNISVFDENGEYNGEYTGHQDAARVTRGVEVRFYSTVSEIEFTCHSTTEFSVMVFSGDYQVAYFSKEAGTHALKASYSAALGGVREGCRNRFGKDLWRISFMSATPVSFKPGDFERSYPALELLPQKKMLAYGSSITAGSGTFFATLSYIEVAAEMLGLDVINKALPGGCFCEKEVVDFLLKEDFEIGYFELGTNIANRPVEIIEDRVGTLIDRVCKAFPDKTLYFMTPVLGLSDVSDTTPLYDEYFENTRSTIINHASRYENAVILDGHKLLDKPYYLAHDILHPSSYGHVMMGVNLYNMIKEAQKK